MRTPAAWQQQWRMHGTWHAVCAARRYCKPQLMLRFRDTGRHNWRLPETTSDSVLETLKRHELEAAHRLQYQHCRYSSWCKRTDIFIWRKSQPSHNCTASLTLG